MKKRFPQSPQKEGKNNRKYILAIIRNINFFIASRNHLIISSHQFSPV